MYGAIIKNIATCIITLVRHPDFVFAILRKVDYSGKFAQVRVSHATQCFVFRNISLVLY